jgi:integrase
MAKYIKQKPDGSLHAVLRVPQDVWPFLKKKTRFLQRSLKTRDWRKARADVHAVIAEWQNQFERIRSQPMPSDAEQRWMAADHYDAYLHDGDVRRGRVTPRETVNVMGLEIEIGGRNHQLEKRKHEAWLAALYEQADEPDKSPVTYFADDLIRREGLKITKGTPEYRNLCERLLRAEMEAAKRAIELNNFEYGGSVTDPVVMRPDPSELPAKKGERIMDLFDEFMNENPHYDRSTKAAYTQAVRWFAQFVGENMPVRPAFARPHAREFKKTLKLAPRRATDTGVFKELKFRKIIEANKAYGKPVISDQRINLILRGCGSFSKWLANHDYIEDNPFAGLTLKINVDRGKYPPFTIDELQTLIDSPVFAGARSERIIHQPGNVMINDHRRWLWLLGLFTGARLGEMGLLEREDIHEHKGIMTIRMPTEKQRRGGVRVDPRNLARPVPVHQDLIRLGFLDYVRNMIEAGEKMLFPKIKPAASGKLTDEESKRLNRYLAQIGIKTNERGVVFHSTRSTFVDAMRRGGVEQQHYDLLIKLGESTVTRRHYGEELDGTIEQRAQWIGRLRYDGLDLGALA